MNGHLEHAGHIQLGCFPGKEVFLRAALPRHFVDQRDPLGFRRDHVIIFAGDPLQQFPGAGAGEFLIPENDKSGNIQIVRQTADGQVSFQPGNGHMMIELHEFLLL